MYTIDDIDVFIATHNRSMYLTEMIECVLRQTVRPKTFTVLDNESVDDTEQVVAKYKDQGGKYLKTYGHIGNFLKSQELASKEFYVFLHDDNLLHPQFFERILLGLNSIKDVAGIASSYDFCYTNVNTIKDPIEDIKQHVKSSVELNKSFLIYENWFDFCRNNILTETEPWPKISPGTPALIYRTEVVKHRHPENEEPVYGKASDLPVYKAILEKGRFVLLQDINGLIIREHNQRDLYVDDNGLFLEQCLNWISIYTDEMNKHVCKDLWLHFWEMIYWLYPKLAKKTLLAEYDFDRFCNYLIEKDFISDEGKSFYPAFLKKLKDTGKPANSSVPFTNKALSFWEKLFSVRNEWTRSGKKKKVLRLFGLKIGLGVKKGENHV